MGCQHITFLGNTSIREILLWILTINKFRILLAVFSSYRFTCEQKIGKINIVNIWDIHWGLKVRSSCRAQVRKKSLWKLTVDIMHKTCTVLHTPSWWEPASVCWRALLKPSFLRTPTPPGENKHINRKWYAKHINTLHKLSVAYIMAWQFKSLNN